MTLTEFDIFFYLFALVAVVAGVMVVFLRNLVHAAFALLFGLVAIAGVYVLLDADFLAVTQLMIYVGGILILIVFGIMLTNTVTNIELQSKPLARLPALVVTALLLTVIVFYGLATNWITHNDAPWANSPWNQNAVSKVTAEMQGTAREVLDHNGSQGTSLEIGKLMLTDYLLPFELVSVVLLVSLIGAAMIARKDPEADAAGGTRG
jgi:NADH:ubiquinone oxidoreductase subunit 6 (subunit J)